MRLVWRLLALLGLIALIEFIIMLSLPLLGIREGYLRNLLDAALLIVIIMPFIYVFVKAEKRAGQLKQQNIESEEKKKLVEEALAERVRHAALGADVGISLTRGETLRTALQGCAEAVVKYLEAAFARIWTLNEKDGVLELQASAGMYTHIDGAHGRVPVGKYKIGLIAQEKTPHLTNSVIGDPRVHNQEWAEKEGMVSFAGHPLMINGKVVGVMAMFARKPLSEATLSALGSVADEIAIGIERKRMEDDLRDSEARFRSLVEESMVGAYIIQDGRFVYCNDRFAEMYGYTREEVCGLPGVLELVHPDDRRFVDEVLKGRASGKIENIQYQIRGLRKDTGVINVEVLGWSTDYNGRKAVIGTALDITQRKRAEEERTALFYMLTHDIKGPLSIISGYGDLLSETITDQENASMVEEIKKASARISRLINDMLELSKIESGATPLNLEPVSIPELLRAAMVDCEMPVLEMDISIHLEVDDDMPKVRGDKAQLERAVCNLVANAVNYNRHGGKIWIRGGLTEAAPDRAYIEVADTGIGILPEDLPQIFNRYYRGKKDRYRRGTGLGLAIVKAVVDAHGGDISVTSNEGEGSTFRVFLPVEPPYPRH